MGRKATFEGRKKRLESVRKSIYNLERDLYIEGKIGVEDLTQFTLDPNPEIEVEVVS